MTEQKGSVVSTIIAWVIVFAIVGAVYYGAKAFFSSVAELSKKEDAEFVATFNLPIGDIVAPDIFELRRKFVNNRLHAIAMELDRQEKELTAADKAILAGTGVDYQRETIIIKNRREALTSAMAKLAEDKNVLDHKILIANHGGYYDIETRFDALKYPSNDISQTEILAWVSFVATAFLIGLGLMFF